MPITQSRFLDILTAASYILDAQQNIITLLSDNASVISRANSAREHRDFDGVVEANAELIGIINTVNETVNTLMRTHVSLIATVMAERKYFTRQKVDKNEQYRRLQANRRAQQSLLSAPSFSPNRPLPAAIEPTHTNWEPNLDQAKDEIAPTWKPDIAGAARAIAEEQAKEREALGQIKRPSRAIDTSAGASYDKSVVKTNVPSLDELNTIGTVTSNENVL